VPASFTFYHPAPPSSKAATYSRKPQYLPATAQSIEISIVQVDGTTPSPVPAPTIANFGSTAAGCKIANGVNTCTVTLGLPVGSDTVLAKVFDAPSATGNLLSQQQSTFVVVKGSANSFSMTLDASPGQIVVTPLGIGATCSGSPLACSVTGSSSLSFTVTVADAHGTPLANNTIAGSPVLSATSSDTTIASVTATQNPYGVSLTPVGSGTATITLTASPATGTSELSPTTVAFTVTPSLGNIYVSNYGNSTATEYGPSGGSPTLTITSGVSSPAGVAVDSSGNIYVANANSNTITKYSTLGRYSNAHDQHRHLETLRRRGRFERQYLCRK
jgi:hypothetical protein